VILESGHDLTYIFQTQERASEIFAGIKQEYVKWLKARIIQETGNEVDIEGIKIEEEGEEIRSSLFIEFGDQDGNDIFFPIEQLTAMKLEKLVPDKHRSLQIEYLDLSNKELKIRLSGENWKDDQEF